MNNQSHSSQLRVALAGLGTVGAGVYKILTQNADLIKTRTGKTIEVVAVSARNKSKDRGVDLSAVEWVDNPKSLATRHDVDVVVEMMGGEGDPAFSLVKSALGNGKSVVTANKSLLAHHGLELAALAEQSNVSLMYEAAVAGGIPIIKMIREGLAANNIAGLYGIMNGTCNYILTTMERTGQSFGEVLKEAQALGYAEADPTLDVGGGDSGHKLALLTALAFGCKPDFDGLSLDGIDKLTAEDLTVAAEFDCRIKLIGQAKKLDDGRVLQMVGPCLVQKTSPLAHVDGVLNGIFVHGDFVGPSFTSGRGAGEGPTASAIVADLMDLASGISRPVFGVPTRSLNPSPTASSDDWNGKFYIRLVVHDRPGVIAEIAPVLRDRKISIESLIQRGRSADQPVSIILTTHETTGADMHEAAGQIGKLGCVLGQPLVLPILNI
ncbi:MAG TPA: homoserine dehydrogenase [Alphaproteobacteria bacterium]|nr:homoserine dehydrogenase [Alphaproteobacteria bacterium]